MPPPSGRGGLYGLNPTDLNLAKDSRPPEAQDSGNEEPLDLRNALHTSPNDPLTGSAVGGVSPKRSDGLVWPPGSQQLEEWGEGDVHPTENTIERSGVSHQLNSYAHIQLQSDGLQSVAHKNGEQQDAELGFKRGSLATADTSSSLSASHYHLQQEYDKQYDKQYDKEYDKDYDRGDVNRHPQVNAGSELPPKYHPSVTASRGALGRTVETENSALDKFMSEEQENLAAGFLLGANAGDQPPEIQERMRGGGSRVKDEVGVNKQCQHCGRTFGREEALEKHEGVCQRMFRNGGGLRKGGGLCAAQGAACRVQGQLALKEKEQKARERALNKRNSRTHAWQRQRYHSSQLPGAPLSRQTAGNNLRQRLGGGAPHIPHAALPQPIRPPIGDLCPAGQ
ncbi:hypothetical protein Emed_005880 [Eimeria media]